MPRSVYVPVASALCQLVQDINKIAYDFRLGARSGCPIYQEPFDIEQMGSSAMPGKKNTIITEQIDGMAMMAIGYLTTIMQTIKTWEERSIEQSCVERVSWPDLFHVAMRCLGQMGKVLANPKVYPENMMREIVETRGTYAASKAKEVLKQHGEFHGLPAEEAYRIVQLAAFNLLYSGADQRVYMSLESADKALEADLKLKERDFSLTIREIILDGKLVVCPDLKPDVEQVKKWNETLKAMFQAAGPRHDWNEVFKLSNLLKGEKVLWADILGE